MRGSFLAIEGDRGYYYAYLILFAQRHLPQLIHRPIQKGPDLAKPLQRWICFKSP